MHILFLLIGLLSVLAFGTDSDLCDILDMPNCRGVTKQLRRNTFQSAPTSSAATNLNPSNVRFDKGLGIEGIVQEGNPVLYGLASGTGRMGGALISGSQDNTFFGNRVPEHDEEILSRSQNDKQYKNQKVTGAFGVRLFANKNYGLDVGIIAKRNKEIKVINPGGGLSARLWFLHFGASVFRDDYDLDMKVVNKSSGQTYSELWGVDKYRDSFTVSTYTFGLRIKNFSFDIASINSSLKYYKDHQDVPNTRIGIYSASFNYESFLLNAAIRNEHSGAKTFVSPDTMKIDHDKSYSYFGLQYSIGNHIVVGVHYNYFLLNEASASLALFF